MSKPNPSEVLQVVMPPELKTRIQDVVDDSGGVYVSMSHYVRVSVEEKLKLEED